jgi:hypothetical protein
MLPRRPTSDRKGDPQPSLYPAVGGAGQTPATATPVSYGIVGRASRLHFKVDRYLHD